MRSRQDLALIFYIRIKWIIFLLLRTWWIRLLLNFIFLFCYTKSINRELSKNGIVGFCKRRLQTSNMRYYCLAYKVTYQEFFIFNFSSKTHSQRKEYVGHNELRRILSYLHVNKKSILIDDKAELYKSKYPLLGRQYKYVTEPKDITYDFSKDKFFLIKPVDGSCGNGIQIIKKNEIKKILLLLKSFRGILIEEVINQDEKMSVFHPQSVNTIRIVTYKEKEQVAIIYGLIRMGCGNNIVDNVSANGICAPIDIKTGHIYDDAVNYDGQRFQYHPDSNKKVKDFYIPMWEELIDIIRKEASAEENVHYIGWDFALSNNKWVLVEANSVPSPLGIQVCTNSGIRPLLKSYLGNRYI